MCVGGTLGRIIDPNSFLAGVTGIKALNPVSFLSSRVDPAIGQIIDPGKAERDEKRNKARFAAGQDPDRIAPLLGTTSQ